MKQDKLKEEMIKIIRPYLLKRGLYGELAPTELYRLLTEISDEVASKILNLIKADYETHST